MAKRSERSDPAIKVSATHEPAPSAGARSLFWVSAAFYALIAFEFFYMASPFAAYFYAVYGPGLDSLEAFGFTDRSLWFFLPHIVAETRSPLVDHARTAGAILFFAGLLAFFAGAFQVYRAKLRRSGMVSGGLYERIRHPQYLALIVSSVGLLMLWPRFLVLFSTIALIFAYVLLARTEEAICLRRYPGYADYRARTGMFLPKPQCGALPQAVRRLLDRPRQRRPTSQRSDEPTRTIRLKVSRVSIWLVAFVAITALATLAATGVRGLAIAALYTHDSPNGVYASLVRIDDEELARVARVASGAPAARDALDNLAADEKIIAYVLPNDMYVSEIPMRLPAGERFGHTVPRESDPVRYKVVFTRADFGERSLPDGASILAHAINKFPLLEVHVDLSSDVVTAVHPPPAVPYYDGHQVPLF